MNWSISFIKNTVSHHNNLINNKWFWNLSLNICLPGWLLPSPKCPLRCRWLWWLGISWSVDRLRCASRSPLQMWWRSLGGQSAKQGNQTVIYVMIITFALVLVIHLTLNWWLSITLHGAIITSNLTRRISIQMIAVF